MKKLVAVAVPLGLVVVLAGCGSGSASPSSTTASTTLPVSDTLDPATSGFALTIGVNSGPKTAVEFIEGDNVVLTIENPSSDDEVHVHGYDLTTGPLPKGQKATLAFTADKVGEFEVESHITEEVLMVIRVTAK